jgi:hypothetical protein
VFSGGSGYDARDSYKQRGIQMSEDEKHSECTGLHKDYVRHYKNVELKCLFVILDVIDQCSDKKELSGILLKWMSNMKLAKDMREIYEGKLKYGLD